MNKTFYFKQNNLKNFQTIKNFLNKSLDEKTSLKEDFMVTISKLTKSPTNAQRAYYFAVVLKTLQDYSNKSCGGNYSIDDIDTIVRESLNFKDDIVSPFDGTVKVKLKSMSNKKGDIQESSEYINRVIAWAAEFGVEIPEATVMGYEF